MHIPEWMTRPDAALSEVRDVQRISLRALSELRNLIDAFLLVPDQSRTGGHDEQQTPQVETRGTVSPGTTAAPDNGQTTGDSDSAPFHDHRGGHGSSGPGGGQPDDTGGLP